MQMNEAPALDHLRALITAALDLADRQGVSMVGIRLDQARLALEEAGEPRRVLEMRGAA